MFELHYATTRNSCTVHKAGCLHGRPGTIVVIPLSGDTVAAAMKDGEVLDLIDREYVVKASPCTKEAK